MPQELRAIQHKLMTGNKLWDFEIYCIILIQLRSQDCLSVWSVGQWRGLIVSLKDAKHVVSLQEWKDCLFSDKKYVEH